MASAVAQDNASVTRGESVFQEECSRCHVPVEMDMRLRARWIGRAGGDLYNTIRTTMPPEPPGSLTNQQYIDVTAYILRAGSVAIADEISADALTALTINPGEVSEATEENF